MIVNECWSILAHLYVVLDLVWKLLGLDFLLVEQHGLRGFQMPDELWCFCIIIIIIIMQIGATAARSSVSVFCCTSQPRYAFCGKESVSSRVSVSDSILLFSASGSKTPELVAFLLWIKVFSTSSLKSTRAEEAKKTQARQELRRPWLTASPLWHVQIKQLN